MKRKDIITLRGTYSERGATCVDYSILASFALILVLPIVTMVQATDATFHAYAVGLCGGGSDSTTGTGDGDCYDQYLRWVGFHPSTPPGQSVQTPNGTPVGLGRIIHPAHHTSD